MTYLTDIKSANWQLSTAGFGEVVEGPNDINQALGLVLMTVKGSDPFRPDFGSDIWDHTDKPINVAAPAIVNSITQAVAIWERRVKLTKVTYEFQKQDFEAEGMKSGIVFSIGWEAVAGTGNGEFALTFNPSATGVQFIVPILGTESGLILATESGQAIII